jgi:hypothetical protein
MKNLIDNYKIFSMYRYSREELWEEQLEDIQETILKMRKNRLQQFFEFLLSELNYIFQPVPDH